MRHYGAQIATKISTMTNALVSRREGAPIFGGSETASFERNCQSLEWRLPGDRRLRFEARVHQLDGKGIYAIEGGPKMPLNRSVSIETKKFLGWKKLGALNEVFGGFDLINAAIRTTDGFRDATSSAQEAMQMRLKSYEHDRFGEHRYYNLSDQEVAAAITEFVLSCGSPEAVVNALHSIDDNPDEQLAQAKADWAELLKEYQGKYR